MILERGQIKLVKLTEDQIELVRNWRNDPKITQYMFYREYITPEMQKAWFNKINNDRNFFFIIEVNNKKIGLIDLKNIDYENLIGEVGIFIYEDEFQNTDIPYRASLLLLDFAFYTIKLNQVYCRILSTNKRAIRYNLSLGFKKCEDEEDKYILDRESYEKAKAFIVRFLDHY